MLPYGQKCTILTHMQWTIYFTSKAGKQVKRLKNERAIKALRLLVECLKNKGPSPGKEWPNYSKLKGKKQDCRHCHLLKGNPTYVCCWEIVNSKNRIIEVYYVGTHEKAPY